MRSGEALGQHAGDCGKLGVGGVQAEGLELGVDPGAVGVVVERLRLAGCQAVDVAEGGGAACGQKE